MAPMLPVMQWLQLTRSDSLGAEAKFVTLISQSHSRSVAGMGQQTYL